MATREEIEIPHYIVDKVKQAAATWLQQQPSAIVGRGWSPKDDGKEFSEWFINTLDGISEVLDEQAT